MKKLLLTSFAAAALLASPAMEGTAEAGAAACAKGIKDCVGAGAAINAKANAAKEACLALKDCKKQCRNTKGIEKLACRSSQSGGEMKHCKKNLRANKKNCVATCKDQYKSVECVNARRQTVGAIAKGLGKCASGIAKCTPATYALCLEGVSYCASKAPKIVKDLKAVAKTASDNLKNITQSLKDTKNKLGGKGACKAYRTAKKACRNTKKACKKICKKGDKDEKKGCIAVCKGDKNVCISELVEGKSNCKAARKAAGAAFVTTLKEIVESVGNIAGESSKVKKAYQTLVRCKMKLSACSAI